MAVSFTTNHGIGCQARSFAHALNEAGLDVYAYKFSRQPSFPVELMYGAGANVIDQRHWGAYHGSELPFVFGNAVIPAYGEKGRLNREEMEIARKIGEHWLSLAASGAP